MLFTFWSSSAVSTDDTKYTLCTQSTYITFSPPIIQILCSFFLGGSPSTFVAVFTLLVCERSQNDSRDAFQCGTHTSARVTALNKCLCCEARIVGCIFFNPSDCFHRSSCQSVRLLKTLKTLKTQIFRDTQKSSE